MRPPDRVARSAAALLGAARRIERKPRLLAALAAVLALLCGVAALQAEPSASPSLLSADDSEIGEATAAQQGAFGGEPIVISAEADLATETLAPPNLIELVDLEGRLARLPGVDAVYGPGTFINQTVIQIQEVVEGELGPIARQANEAGQQARQQALDAGASPRAADAAAEEALAGTFTGQGGELRELFARYGYIGLPSLSNTNFIRALVFGSSTEPKEKFGWLFPDSEHALVVVRPEAGLSDDRLQELGASIQDTVDSAGLREVDLTVAGAPLVAAAMGDEIADELVRLAPVVFVGMVAVLLLALRRREGRLRPLLLAGGAVLATAGAGSALGLGLTPATVAALPVVLGLAVDFAIQLQARFRANRATGSPPRAAALAARRTLGGTLTLAAGAMSVGFMALTLSAIPLVDRLGQTLAIGTLASLGIVLGFGPVLLAWRDRGGGDSPQLHLPATLNRVAGSRAIVAVLCIVAVGGVALSGQTEVESDLTELAPEGLDELAQVERLQSELGTSGELRVAIEADDVTDPEVLAWTQQLGERVLALDEGLQPGPNLADLLLGEEPGLPSRQEIDELLAVVPGYFLGAVLTDDRTRSEVSFGVPLSSVGEQARLLGEVERLLDDAPAGVEAHPAGLVAAAADSVRELEGGRPWLLLVASAAIFALLLAVRRSVARAALPLVPALLAAGFSALLLVLLDVRLSPLSAGLEPLVLAVGVEFGILLEARYREARLTEGPALARAEAVRRVGAPVAISTATVAVGFGTLVVSRLDLLQQFGALVAVELGLCLAAAVLFVPRLCEWVDRRRAEQGERGRSGLRAGLSARVGALAGPTRAPKVAGRSR